MYCTLYNFHKSTYTGIFIVHKYVRVGSNQSCLAFFKSIIWLSSRITFPFQPETERRGWCDRVATIVSYWPTPSKTYNIPWIQRTKSDARKVTKCISKARQITHHVIMLTLCHEQININPRPNQTKFLKKIESGTLMSRGPTLKKIRFIRPFYMN